MALTQISTQGIKDGTITGSDLATNIDLVDDQKLRLGTGNDLQIFHDGTHSRIYNDTATSLNLTSADFTFNSANNSEQLARFTGNGSCEFYFNNSKKLETTTNGTEITGQLQVLFNGATASSIDGTVDIRSVGGSALLVGSTNGQGAILKLDGNANGDGADGDYGRIWHNSSGILFIDNLNTAREITFRARGQVERLKILSTGHIDIPADDARLRIGAGQDLQLYHSSNENIIGVATTGQDIFFKSSASSSLDTTSFVVRTDGSVTHPDNIKMKFGTSDDLQIYHDGSHSYINNTGTGHLYIKDTGIVKIISDSFKVDNAAETKQVIKCNPDAGVEIYYDGTKKFETTSAGIAVTGAVEPTGHIKLGDNSFVYFGAGVTTDLYIGHEPSSSRHLFRSGDGATKMVFQGGSETMMVLQPQGAVELYHDNSKKFETQTNGITVTGGVYSDGLICGDSEMVELGNSGDLQIYHDGTSNIFLANSGDLNIRMNNSENAIVARQNGAAELYHNNVKKFETEDAGVRVTGRLNMQVNSNTTYPTSFGTNAYVPFAHELVIDNNVGGAQGSFAGIFFNAGADTDGSKVGTARISAVETGNYKADLVFATRSTGFSEKARITHNGVLMIGATSTLSNETRLTVRNDTEAKVSTFHHNHNSQRSCIDCQNDYAAGSNSAIMIEFRRDNGTSVGGIFASTSNVSYNTASDYRLKENQVAISDGITRLKELKPYKFNFKENKDKIVDGFFAHEVSSVVPEAITGIKDEVDENNDPVYQGIDQSKLVPLLVASLQEAIGKIEVLETEVAALKAA